MNEIHLSSSEESITASYRHEGFGLSIASADRIFSATVLEGWYISRVMVRENHRRKGIGSKMLNSIIEEIKTRGEKCNIVVFPGGYGEDIKDQINFYEKNGFVESTEKQGMYVYSLTI